MAERERGSESSGIVVATFAGKDVARRALEDLLDAGFLNVEQEAAGNQTDVLVEPDGREGEAMAILSRHGGVGVDLGR